MPQLLGLFGCTDALKDYAYKYGYIIAIGLPFSMIGTTLNSIIRADGSPLYSMVSMIVGAILNIILDAILMYKFSMGIAGAAIATVISQILTFILNVIYIKRFKTIKINKKSFKLSSNISGKILMLGISSFITEMSFVLLMIVLN